MPAAASQHPGDGLPAQLGRGQVVDLGDSAQIPVRSVDEGGGDPDTGVIHQDVDLPGLVLDPLDEGGDLRRVREVGGVGGPPEFSRERPEGVLGPGDERDRSPGPGEGMGEGLADAS